MEAIVWTSIVAVAASIVAHGATAAPLAQRLVPADALDAAIPNRT